MNVKKFFCCVPIINVRQSVTLSHDKAVQHEQPEPEDNNEPEINEGYKNVAFIEPRRESDGTVKGIGPADVSLWNVHGSNSSLNSGHSGYYKPPPIDTSLVIEAHGLLTSLLLENDLPQHVADTLRRVAKILDTSPSTGTPMLARMLTKGGQLSLKPESDPSSDLDDDDDERGNRRSRFKRRLKVSVWSTVTSATGLPTIELEPANNSLNTPTCKKSERANSGRRKASTDDHDSDYSLDVDESSIHVTPWDRRMSKTVTYKRDSKKEHCSLLTNEQKEKLLKPLSDEYECTSEFLSQVDSWSFPIFKFNDSTQHCLSLLGFHIFSTTGLLDTFKINPVHFRNYFEAIEQGYHDVPYHNRIHAADVLQAVYYLVSSSIPGFNQTHDSGSSIGSESGSEDEIQDATEHVPNGDTGDLAFAETYGTLKEIMTDLEALALYTAAAIHDYDHPGRTNAFLVATGDNKAVMYNDRSILESHHVASAWYLLVSDERFNFVSSLSTAEFKRFRFLLIEAVLATDLKRHFDFMAQLNNKTTEGEGMDWSVPEDRILAIQMCMKLADINAPCKDFDLHCQWTERIVEEFYQQGDHEAQFGLPVSPYMNRNKDPPKVPELQLNFIKHLVAPLYHTMVTACLIPGKWVEITPEEMETFEDQNDGTNGLKKMQNLKSQLTPHTHKFVSDLSYNLDSNYAVWDRKNEEYQASLKTNGEESAVTEVAKTPPVVIEKRKNSV